MTDPTTVDTRKTIGRYEIRECIGRGGMGALFRGYDPVLERDVAIKTMLADFSGDDAGRTRFFREARAVARLQHRNIVTLFDFGEEDNTPYIVMEFLHGETLAQRMKTRNGGRVPIDRVLDIGAQLCTGLHFAHARGVVHRDVKPPNIWLNEDGSVKVLDFGIAKFGDTAVTRVGGVVGSVSYMSPEQISGSDVDGRSDIFSVGIVMYELLSGTRPFTGESPTAIMMRIMHEPPLPLDAPGAPPQLVALIERALQKDRSRRFQQAGELAADLRALQFTLTGPHRGASVPDHLVTTAPVSPGAGGSAIAAGGVGAAVVPSASLTRNAPGEWAMGSSEDLVADVVLHTPSSEANAAAAAAAASASAVARANGGAARSFGWAKRWPALAVAGGAVAIASFVFVLLMRAEPAPVSGKPTADKVSVAPVPGDPIAPGHSADHPTTTDKPTPPVADAGAGTPTPTPTPPPPPTPVENTNVHVVLSAPYAFSVSDESGRPLSAAAQSHDLHLAPKQVLRLRSQANHFSQRLTVEGRPGETMRWKAPALGRLTVWAVRETCQLSLDGDSIGSPPISELPVPSGKHTLKLTCPDGDQTVDYVDVTAGTTTLAKLK